MTEKEILARMAELDELAKQPTPYNIAVARAYEWKNLKYELKQLRATKAGA